MELKKDLARFIKTAISQSQNDYYGSELETAKIHLSNVVDLLYNIEPIKHIGYIVEAGQGLQNNAPDNTFTSILNHNLPMMIEQNQRIAEALPSIQIIANILGDLNNLFDDEEDESN